MITFTKLTNHNQDKLLILLKDSGTKVGVLNSDKCPMVSNKCQMLPNKCPAAGYDVIIKQIFYNKDMFFVRIRSEYVFCQN